MSIIGSFLDESFDEQPYGVFVVGGVMGRGVPIFELERRWEKLLKRPDIDIDYFKASECEHGTGQFAKFVKKPRKPTLSEADKLRSISREFLSTIVKPPFDKNYLVIGGVGVVQADFYDIIKDPKARGILGASPYKLAYDFAMIQGAWAMKELGTGDFVAFVCDEHEEHSPLAPEEFRKLNETNKVAASYMATFSSEDEKDCIALQAADAAVYEIRRALRFSLGMVKSALREQFNILTDTRAMFIINHTSREQLEHIVATHEPGEPFKLDALMELQIAADRILI